ncbi:MAG: hypothetical protein M3Z04_02815 [Chloroflexota bacterium]|nr:hypothetical protein [Chloroflexota bacterium]
MSDEADASLLNGLILGVVVGAGLVILLSPEVRGRIQAFAQEQGLGPSAADLASADAQRDAVLQRVAPPPDPLGSSPAE